MLNIESKRRLASLAMFALPLLMVKGMAVLMGGPSNTKADDVKPALGPAASQPALAKPKWSPQQLAAGQYMKSLRSEDFGPTPFLYEREEVQPAPPVIDKTPEPVSDEIPRFTLHAIMSGHRGKMALIDSRPYAVGDHIRGSMWTVTNIDSDARSVTLKNDDDGREISLNVDPRLKLEN